MCGIVGVAGNLLERDAKAFKDLLYMDTLRGDHSTGVLSVNNALTNYEVLKRVGPAYYLMESKQFDKVVSPAARVLLGHNRYGTMGKATSANAHPFDFENVCGVHNGTLPWDVKNKFKNASDFDTDSEAFYNHMDSHGPEVAINLISKGAYCFVWWDKDTDELCMIRNDERPMWFTLAKDKTVMYWASEPAMLMAALSRNSITYSELHFLAVNKLHRWRIPKGNDTWADPVVTEIIPKKEEPVVHGQNFQYRPPWERNEAQQETKKEVGKTAQVGAVKVREPTEDEKFVWSTVDLAELHIDDTSKEGWHSDESLVKWFRRRYPNISLPSDAKVTALPSRAVKTYVHPKTRAEIKKEEFDEITEHGCDWCQSSVDWGDDCALVCVDGSAVEVICEKCIKNPDVQQYMHS